MRNMLIRPIIVISLILGFFIVGELLVIGGLTWRNHQRLQVLRQDITDAHQLEDSMIVLLSQQIQPNYSASSNHTSDPNLVPTETVSDTDMHADIQQLQHAFFQAQDGNNQSLKQALVTIRKLFLQHNQEEETLLKKIAQDSKLEFELAVSVPFVLLGGVLLIGRFFFKRHVIEPLDSLKSLLQQLADGDRKPITQHAYDPVVQSLFDNYNKLVMRLTSLEKEQLNYTNALETQVRQIGSQLLEQSQQIARSERLSVVAELSASTAHELRNPLAGIQLALENILQENQDIELSQRLQQVNDEIKRLTMHLNDLLALTRSSETMPTALNINQVCQELKEFIKYQMSENITLNDRIDKNLVSCLPETEFRLAMINLLLNSSQAIGKRPGQIQLSAIQQDQRIIITVEDSGPGFSESLLQKGIQPFVSLKSEGTGLGLAMVQRFVKSQQGLIRLFNTEAGHACVTLTLPIITP